MKSHAVSVKPTTTLVSPSISLVQDVPQTGTSKGQVIFKEFSAPPKPMAVPGAIDIDDLVAELESQSPENAEAIAHGRQWVAETFMLTNRVLPNFVCKKVGRRQSWLDAPARASHILPALNWAEPIRKSARCEKSQRLWGSRLRFWLMRLVRRVRHEKDD